MGTQPLGSTISTVLISCSLVQGSVGHLQKTAQWLPSKKLLTRKSAWLLPAWMAMRVGV
jgi:hypothetical protein